MPADNDQQHADSHDDDIAVLQEQVRQVDRFKHDAIGHNLEEGKNGDQRNNHAVFTDMGAQIVTK